MIVVPGLIHAVAAGGFIAPSDIYQRAPNRHSILGWHIRYMIMAALTGVSYGGGGALLVNLPDAEPRLVVCATLAVAAEIAPGRLYAPKAFLAFAAVNILLLAAGLAVQGSNVALAQSESEGTRNTMQAVLDNMGDGAALYAEDGTCCSTTPLSAACSISTRPCSTRGPMSETSCASRSAAAISR